MLATVAEGLNIFDYKAPLISLKEGRGWIIDGNFKLVHVIDLGRFEEMLGKLDEIIYDNLKEQDRKQLIQYHLNQTRERIDLLKGKSLRKRRSINWIGSAWKWIAGNPDAADWDQILRAEEKIALNNNQQYKINNKIFGITAEITGKINLLISRVNNGIKDSISGRIEQDILNEILVVKGEINEIVRACQIAKKGLINTNLLDKEEIGRLVNEIETLPYANEIEAIEYGTPAVFTNETILLYILSMPKVRKDEFNLLQTRASIIENKQIDLKFNKMLVNHQETYGIIGDCLSISNTTVCSETALEKVPEEDCVARLLKGGSAACTYRTNTNEITELINSDTIFLTNFKGEVKSNNFQRTLEGTFILQMQNETVQINKKTFRSHTITVLQALPPALTNITKQDNKLDLGYVHNIGLTNIERLSNLDERFKISLIAEAAIILLFILVIHYLWRKMHPKISFPSIQISANPFPIQGQHPTPQKRINQSSISDVTTDLRDVDF